MLNQIVLVGRLVQDPETKELENGIKTSYITLAVKRSYKNVNGDYEADLIPVKLYKGISESIVEYCKIGDIVGVRGRVQSRKEEDKSIIEVIAEKVTFLSTRKE